MERFTLDYPRDMSIEDWLDLRAPYFNASMAGALLGVHPYETLADVCVQKLTGNRTEETAAMRRGTDMEPYIADKLADLISRKLVRPRKLYGYGPMLATLDFEDEDPDYDAHYEIKSTTEYIRDEPLPYWYAQAQAQMGCRGTTRTIIGFLDPRLEVQMLEVYFDEGFFERLIVRAQAVMSTLALGEMPAFVEAEMSGQNVQDLWPQDDGDCVDLSNVREALETLLGYEDARLMVKEWEERQKNHRDALTRLIRGHSAAMVRGLEVFTFKAPKPTRRFNMTRFTEEHPELVEEYTEETPSSRRLDIKRGNIKKLEREHFPARPDEEEIL